MKENKILKIVLISVITLTALLCPFFECFGVYYAEEFPSQIGLAGGFFVKLKRSSGSAWVVLIPDNYIDSFTFQGDGTLINTSSNTINTKMISIDGQTVYNARFQSLGTLQYYTNNSYTWTDYTGYEVLDMNIYPKSSDPDYANQNLHLDYNTRHLVIALFFLTLIIVLIKGVNHDR